MASSPGLSVPRFIGIDVGAETIKLVELVQQDESRVTRVFRAEHNKNPQPLLEQISRAWDLSSARSIALTGRLGKNMSFARVPLQQAQLRAFRFLYPGQTGTLVSIGSHGFSVLEIRPSGPEVYRENSRCSQGTGNFLRQLTSRFSLTVEEAGDLCAGVQHASALSGRCPVILKTDMTHLANKGENRAEILAGLFDAVCENVLNLVKPGLSPNPIVLIGGVSQSLRVQSTMRQRLARSGYDLILPVENALHWEAIGAALLAADQALPAAASPSATHQDTPLEKTPPLASFLGNVRRMAPVAWEERNGFARDLILGLDIGSTGAKAVALDAGTQTIVWEAYRQTQGAPVEAAQDLWRQFLESAAGAESVRAACVTGSGREIVGSLLIQCYGSASIFIQNEIAAHAAGACHYDPRVDTIFEIGGQDAKYIRLDQGRVVDCAMNEACSAGTGSFIEEQGRKFAGIDHVAQLGEAALASPEGVSLGQHCSVFMAEIIDEAAAAGIPQNTIIAGLYDSIVQNYLNRVKGSRSIGQVIFCQGMPFSADALAAAVARQTGSEVIIPPNPGTVGALGITLLARSDLPWKSNPPLDLHRFLTADVDERSTFVCNATVGCGAPGNHCRIDRIRTRIAGSEGLFTWGGACSLHEKVTRRHKLPNGAPHPFREREQLISDLLRDLDPHPHAPRIALSDEFMLKELFPYFATFLSELGFGLTFVSGAEPAILKQGIQQTNLQFCAPMQLFHGVAARMRTTDASYVFAPVLRSTMRAANEPNARVCPIVQSAPFLLRYDLAQPSAAEWLSPEIQIGRGGLESPEFRSAVQSLALHLCAANRFELAHELAVGAQRRFAQQCDDLGRRALQYCRDNRITPVVVLGRPYTIYNPVLNSNVPAILREQGALPIPADCYPVPTEIPVLDRIYWGYAQRLLRAAHHIRRAPSVYSVYCSNYSCGPDSFNLHFFAYEMEGKPFAIIETDGHSGDAGTKTRIEAFLHCVAQDQSFHRQATAANAVLGGKSHAAPVPAPHDLPTLADHTCDFSGVDRERDTILVPWMGSGSRIAAACLRASGYQAEAMAIPDNDALKTGRRYTSGKECVPVALTLGRLILTLQNTPGRTFAYMMPRTNGPCRLGLYHLLQKIVIERLGLGERCKFISPHESDYFAGQPAGFTTLFVAGIIAHDLLHDALLLTRPAERRRGSAEAIHARYSAALCALVERQGKVIRSSPRTLAQILAGRLFGIPRLLRSAARDFATIHCEKNLPTVSLVGEIYVRHDAFVNGGIVDRLEARGMRVRFAPLAGWFDYIDHCNQPVEPSRWTGVLHTLKQRIRHLEEQAIHPLPLIHPAPVDRVIQAASQYLSGDIGGEAVLTLGHPLAEWRYGLIDAAVNVGPLECMPTRICESQMCHIAEREGLLTLTLPFNGDPLPDDALDNFAFQVHARFHHKQAALQ